MKKTFIGASFSSPQKTHLKVFLAMKLTFLFMLIACLQVSAGVKAQSITFSKREASLEKVFMEIRNQTGYEFLYNTDAVAHAKVMDLHFNRTPLKEALDDIFKDQPLAYDIIGKTIVVREKSGAPTSKIQAPVLIQIKGTVVDSATGSPLVGVTIKVRGGTMGTISDGQGKFSLDVPDNAVLEISYLGYDNKLVQVSGQTELTIRLSSAATSLNQIVVIGYGTEKRSNIIGSVSQINAKDIDNRPVPQLSQVIQGQMPGVTAIESSGQPGKSGESITIRGIGSFGASTSPLILVDGIPVSSMDDIDPNNVQSISVLKDASSAAIYGARAANGVILITTKSGSKDHKLHVSYNGYVSIQRATAYPKMVNSWQFAELSNEAEPGSFTQAQIDSFKLGNDPYNYPNTNWVNMV
ncbi:MAG: TonB-dependent receptor plug domain-containing protein, partial [Chitinophagaceae bacterium]